MSLRFRHFKGGTYELVTIAKLESDPTVELVIYKSDATGLTWAREWSNFFERIERADYVGPRFEEINEV